MGGACLGRAMNGGCQATGAKRSGAAFGRGANVERPSVLCAVLDRADGVSFLPKTVVHVRIESLELSFRLGIKDDKVHNYFARPRKKGDAPREKGQALIRRSGCSRSGQFRRLLKAVRPSLGACVSLARNGAIARETMVDPNRK